MLETEIVVQDVHAGRTSVVINRIIELASAARFRRVRVAVAYASYSGCHDLVNALRGRIRNWNTLQKQWLVSIDFGRTETEALEYLWNLPDSEVRIPDAVELLQNTLIPERCFHPKTYVLDGSSESGNAPFGVFIGSGNLTLSGLHTGVEHATSLLWVPPLSRRERAILERVRRQFSWWEVVWHDASPLTAEILDRYRNVRPRRPREDAARSVRPFAAAVRSEVGSSPGIAWAHARYFWIQTHELYKNLGRDRPGNQLDMRRGTRVYFGFPPDAVPRNTVLGSLTLQFQDNPSYSRSLRFGNNYMDKVNLPIPGEDGPDSYDHSTIRFERLGPQNFRVILGLRNDLRQWRRYSAEQGMLYELAGGREFGFYN